jgi:hypothetical protein
MAAQEGVMTQSCAEKHGRYLYALIDGAGRDGGYGDIGVGNSAVYAISDGLISAVVSDVPNERIRPQRRNLAAHHGVLKTLMVETTPLPMAFGVIADGTRAIRRILSENRKVFTEQLERVAGKVEMGMRVAWDVPNIFEYFVAKHPDLRAARDRHFGGYREPTQEAKLALGRLFDRMLEQDREAHAAKVMQVLSSFCHEIKENRCRSEQEVMNLACLVEREALQPFDEGVFAAAGLFDNHFAFEYNGPWAPHNFVDIRLEL